MQVVTGGHYDVDVILTDPTRNVLYKQIKKQYDSHTWTAAKTGEYIACFSNEFSTFSHKLVYIDFQVGDEDPLPGMEGAVEPLTQVTTNNVKSQPGMYHIFKCFKCFASWILGSFSLFQCLQSKMFSSQFHQNVHCACKSLSLHLPPG